MGNITNLTQGTAWYSPSTELTKFYQQIEKSKAENIETALDNLQSMFDPENYDKGFITVDINSRKTHDDLLELRNEGRGFEIKIEGQETKNPYLFHQMQYYQTLQAIQAMFTLGVKQEKIAGDQSPKGGIALSEIDSNLPANLKMGWLLSQKYGEDSSIGIRDENTGESATVTLRDTRSSNLHGKKMLSALTDPDKSNFLVRLAIKKNIDDPSAAAWKLHPNSVLQVNNDYLMRGIDVKIRGQEDLIDNQDFLPPREEFDF